MFNPTELIILTLVLTHGRGHAGKIYGGHEVVPHSRPYMVLLERIMVSGETQHCGGFLLNEEFVMTAAHCDARYYRVLLGLHNFNEKANIQTISAVEIFPHEDFDAAKLINDLMLIKLSSKATFNSNVRPIHLTDHSDPDPESCIVSGWGRHNHTKYMSTLLWEVSVTIINSELCEKNSYCSEGEGRPAEGDSGGPLVCENGKAYGVVSAHNPSTNISYFTKISDYRDWINSTMKQNGKF